MRSGVPYYSTYGLVDCENQIRVRVNDEFVDVKSLENPGGGALYLKGFSLLLKSFTKLNGLIINGFGFAK